MCEGQSEQQDLLEARSEVVLVLTTLEDPAAAVVTVADEGIGLSEVGRRGQWCEGREQKVRLGAVLRVGLRD